MGRLEANASLKLILTTLSSSINAHYLVCGIEVPIEGSYI